MKRGLILAAFAIGVLLFGLWWQESQTQTVRRSQVIMGTLVEIQVTGHDALTLHRLVDAAFAEMQRLEQLLSPRLASSEVAQLARVRELEVSAETREVLAAGLEVARRSDGAFDVGLGRLVELWDIRATQPRVPSAEQIAAALEGTGPEALQLEGTRVVKRDADLKPELGGVAKGYAVEAAADLLREGEIVAGAVNAGGDMALVGQPDQRAWRIGIRHPRAADQLLATLVLPEGAVATSGDYERYFEHDGTRYHHLFDPRSGYPARACQSVTVWTDDAMYADALATAAFVLGPEQGLQLLEAWPHAEGLLVAADGEIAMTTGMGERVEWP